MKIMFRLSALFPLVVTALVSSCASPARLAEMKKDPFADPSKFESLASNAYTQPVVSLTPMEPVVVAAPSVAETKVMVVPPPTAPLRALDGTTSLVSSPDIPSFSHEAVQREIASAAPATGVSTTAVVPVGTVGANTVSPEGEPRTSDSAFLALVRGNERFVNGTVKGENRGEARRRALASNQNPATVVLSSSDSRVPPELIFDQGLGDLSVVRVAGGVLGSAQVATIEYAVKHLDAKLIVVMGHEGSDAVRDAVEAKGGGSTDEQWVASSIRENLKGRSVASTTGPDPKFRKPAMANVDAVTEQLMLRSKTVSDAVSSGKLKIVRGIYGLDTGRVDFWGM